MRVLNHTVNEGDLKEEQHEAGFPDSSVYSNYLESWLTQIAASLPPGLLPLFSLCSAGDQTQLVHGR